MQLEHWREIIGLMLDAAFLCTRARLPQMQARGGDSILNIGGLTGYSGARDRAMW